MNVRAAWLMAVTTSIIALAACGGDSGGTTATPSNATAPTKAATKPGATAVSGSTQAPAKAGAGGADAALADTCAVLTDADLAPVAKVSGKGQQTPASTGGGVTTAICHWDVGGAASVELTIYVFSAQYAGPKEFAKAALKTSADTAKATAETVSGVGDYAGDEIPPTPGPSVTADFYAQKGSVAIKLSFGGLRTATWPTSAQLQQAGKAAAVKVLY